MNFKYSVLLCLVLICVITINSVSANEINENQKINSIKDNNSLSTSDNTQKTTANTKITKKTTFKIKTKVIAKPVAVKYKKSKNFQIKILKKSNNAKIKNIKLNLRVSNNKQYKNYTIKTNKNGIAKFNTKKLNKGTYKVVISSNNTKYSISKTSKIIVGNEYSTILKLKTKRVLKTKDVIKLKKERKSDKTEISIVFKKKPKHTIISQAKFYLKNKCTGKTLIQFDYCEFEDGRWDILDEDFSSTYKFIKVKVWYLEV